MEEATTAVARVAREMVVVGCTAAERERARSVGTEAKMAAAAVAVVAMVGADSHTCSHSRAQTRASRQLATPGMS